jgi:putative ABC transport system permease protein
MTTNNPQPPKLFMRFFRWYCHPQLLAHIEGDLLELYGERVKVIGKRKADARFMIDVLQLFRRGIIRPAKANHPLNQYDMLANYIKIGLRIIQRNKGYSFLNISGLAVGLASAIFILLWVQNEVNFDRFFTSTDRIYKLYSRDTFGGITNVWQTTPSLMGPEIKQLYEEAEDVTRFRNVYFLAKAGNERFNERGAFGDPSFLKIFDFPLLYGKRDALLNPSSVVLSEQLAIKLFGQTDCIGETVVINETENFTVGAVLKALPRNTEFQFEFMVPWSYMTRLGWDQFDDWTQTNAITYTLLKEGTSAENFISKVRKIVQTQIQEGDGATREIIAHPMAKVHLYSQPQNGELTGGRIDTVRMFATIAILIILIACINFMNLSTARSENRGREVGVRKVAGAQKSALIAQFICESTILVTIAFVIALALVQLLLGPFNLLIDSNLRVDYSNVQYWMYALALIVATGVLAGSYPAFYLSSSQPLKVLKGTFKKVDSIVTPRKVLVVVQFSAAIVLSICAIMVQRQINFAANRDDGYNREGLVFNFLQGEIPLRYESIRNELISTGAALSVTRTFSPVTRIWDVNNSYSWQGSIEEDKTIIFLQFGSDVDLEKTFGIEIIKGRDLDIENYPSDTAAVLLNEAALHVMKFKEPLGEIIKDESGQSFHVVGIVKNFIVGSPYDDVGPMMIKGWRDRYGALHFRLNPGLSEGEALMRAEQVFKKYNPEYPFEYYFADEYYNRKFAAEKQTSALSALFAGLAVFISCLGLFGLAAYMAENRTKEIGIRKVLGASVPRITAMISKEFVVLVFISTVIASPLSYYVVRTWLESFRYRVPIGASVFVVTALAAIAIALLTVSHQAIKAATGNPLKSLRTE